MGKVLQMASADDINWAQSPAEVSFAPVCMNYGDDSFNSSEESEVDVTCKFTTTFSTLGCHVASNSLSTAATTITFRKNGANGNGTLTIPAGTTGTFTDTVNSDSLVSGDKYNAQISTASGGTGTLTFGGIRVVANVTGSHTVQYGCALSTNMSLTANTLYYIGMAGNMSANTTIQNAEVTMGPPGTMLNAQIYVVTNGRSSNTTLRSRINGLNGNIVIVIGGGLTGLFEDTTNTDALSSGDKFCWELQTGASSGNFGVRRINGNYTATSGKTTTVVAHTIDGVSKSSGQTLRAPLAGCIPPAVSTEAEVQCQAGFPFTATKLRIGVSSNTYTGSSTFVLRKNGANSALSVTVPAGTTGIFSDASNSEDFSSTDLANYAWSGGTSGSGTARYFQVDMEDKTATGYSQAIFF